MTTVLPGFLGTIQDWEQLSFRKQVVNLCKDPFLPVSFESWADYLKNEHQHSSRVLIGYSLGGRIVLNALCKYPNFFTRAVIISAHTGLITREERHARYTSDQQWAKRFTDEPWDEVLHEWNNQPVLSGITIDRCEEDYNRAVLASRLTDLSLGKQQDLLPLLTNVSTEVLWITGARDQKFTAIGSTAVEKLPQATHWVCADAGHRVPWEKPEELSTKIAEFLA